MTASSRWGGCNGPFISNATVVVGDVHGSLMAVPTFHVGAERLAHHGIFIIVIKLGPLEMDGVGTEANPLLFTVRRGY